MLGEILSSSPASDGWAAPFETPILKCFEAENGFCPPRCRGTAKVMDVGFWVGASA